MEERLGFRCVDPACHIFNCMQPNCVRFACKEFQCKNKTCDSMSCKSNKVFATSSFCTNAPFPEVLGNGICDLDNNVGYCYDGGDCLESAPLFAAMINKAGHLNKAIYINDTLWVRIHSQLHVPAINRVPVCVAESGDLRIFDSQGGSYRSKIFLGQQGNANSDSPDPAILCDLSDLPDREDQSRWRLVFSAWFSTIPQE